MVVAPMFFIMNCVIIRKFYRMASYFIEMLSKNKSIDKKRAKAFIIFISINIIVSLMFDFLYQPLRRIIVAYEGVSRDDILFLYVMNSLSWVQEQLTPFFSAILLTYIIGYFARD